MKDAPGKDQQKVKAEIQEYDDRSNAIASQFDDISSKISIFRTQFQSYVQAALLNASTAVKDAEKKVENLTQQIKDVEAWVSPECLLCWCRCAGCRHKQLLCP